MQWLLNMVSVNLPSELNFCKSLHRVFCFVFFFSGEEDFLFCSRFSKELVVPTPKLKMIMLTIPLFGNIYNYL